MLVLCQYFLLKILKNILKIIFLIYLITFNNVPIWASTPLLNHIEQSQNPANLFWFIESNPDLASEVWWQTSHGVAWWNKNTRNFVGLNAQNLPSANQPNVNAAGGLSAEWLAYYGLFGRTDLRAAVPPWFTWMRAHSDNPLAFNPQITYSAWKNSPNAPFADENNTPFDQSQQNELRIFALAPNMTIPAYTCHKLLVPTLLLSGLSGRPASVNCNQGLQTGWVYYLQDFTPDFAQISTLSTLLNLNILNILQPTLPIAVRMTSGVAYWRADQLGSLATQCSWQNAGFAPDGTQIVACPLDAAHIPNATTLQTWQENFANWYTYHRTQSHLRTDGLLAAVEQQTYGTLRLAPFVPAPVLNDLSSALSVSYDLSQVLSRNAAITEIKRIHTNQVRPISSLVSLAQIALTADDWRAGMTATLPILSTLFGQNTGGACCQKNITYWTQDALASMQTTLFEDILRNNNTVLLNLQNALAPDFGNDCLNVSPVWAFCGKKNTFVVQNAVILPNQPTLIPTPNDARQIYFWQLAAPILARDWGATLMEHLVQNNQYGQTWAFKASNQGTPAIFMTQTYSDREGDLARWENGSKIWSAGTQIDNTPNLAQNRRLWIGNTRYFPNANTTGLSNELAEYLAGSDTGLWANQSSLRPRKTHLGAFWQNQLQFVDQPNAGFADSDYVAFQQFYKNRGAMLYALDSMGMLYGFDANTGQEKLAYWPMLSLPVTMPLLRTTGKMPIMSQAKLTVQDVRLSTGWRTLMAGTMGTGAAGIWLLDITDAKNTFVSANILWEINAQTVPEFGLGVSTPALSQEPNGKWVVLVGNGDNAPANSTRSGKACLVRIPIESPNQAQTFCVPEGNTAHLNGMTAVAPIDTNQDEKIDRIYTADHYGNIWRFDWETSTQTWQLSLGGKPLFKNPQPFSSDIEVSLNSQPGRAGVVVYAGSGRWLDQEDLYPNYLATLPNHYLYAVFDEIIANPNTPSMSLPILRTDLLEQIADINTKTTSSFELTPAYRGWQLRLPEDARVLTNPVRRGNLLVIRSFTPPETCQIGKTQTYLVRAQDGKAVTRNLSALSPATNPTAQNLGNLTALNPNNSTQNIFEIQSTGALPITLLQNNVLAVISGNASSQLFLPSIDPSQNGNVWSIGENGKLGRRNWKPIFLRN